MPLIQLSIITQEKPVYSGTVDAVIAPATEGEVTILPEHAPLFTKLQPGELKLFIKGRWQVLVLAGGFMDVAPQSKITILADSAVRVEKINASKVEAAKRKAEQELKQDLSQKDFIRATTQLRRSIIELKTIRKYRRRAQIS